MTPKEIRNSRLAQRIINNLARRNMQAFYCPTSQEAVGKVLELIPAGSSVTWGGSMTIRVAAIIWGPKGVIFIIGLKGCADR